MARVSRFAVTRNVSYVIAVQITVPGSAERRTVRKMYPGPIMTRLIALAAFFVPVVIAQEQFIDWQTNYRQALTDAKAANKPVFLEFRCEA